MFDVRTSKKTRRNFIIKRNSTNTIVIAEIAKDYIKSNIKEFTEKGKEQMIKLITSFIFGLFAGVITMCLMQINRIDTKEEK